MQEQNRIYVAPRRRLGLDRPVYHWWHAAWVSALIAAITCVVYWAMS